LRLSSPPSVEAPYRFHPPLPLPPPNHLPPVAAPSPRISPKDQPGVPSPVSRTSSLPRTYSPQETTPATSEISRRQQCSNSNPRTTLSPPVLPPQPATAMWVPIRSRPLRISSPQRQTLQQPRLRRPAPRDPTAVDQTRPPHSRLVRVFQAAGEAEEEAEATLHLPVEVAGEEAPHPPFRSRSPSPHRQTVRQ
jgi:hypothetical protein